jgi:hypothetical protein
VVTSYLMDGASDVRAAHLKETKRAVDLVCDADAHSCTYLRSLKHEAAFELLQTPL